jgi:cobalt-zinc-cadmium resistance protein CzcA
MSLLVVVLGLGTLANLPVDAVPDITSVQVVVNAKTGGLDPQQIEKTVTYFIESEMAGLPKVAEVRSLSRFGLSQVVVVFEDGTDIYWARQLVIERLQSVREQMPKGIDVELAPISTGLGEILMYAVLPQPGSDLEKKKIKDQLLYLRTIQDFVIKPFLKSQVKGVAEVDAIGGYKKVIHVDMNPHKMENYGITFNGLSQRLETLGENYGGGYIEKEGEQIIVRTMGELDLEALNDLPIQLDVFGKPIRLRKVAKVREDFVQRLGAATYKGSETVLGTVLMLTGENSRQVSLNAEKAIKKLPLPKDVRVEIVYSRSFLVNATIKTVAKNLAEGAGLVVLVLLLILGHIRGALIVALAIPISMLSAILGMKHFGISANLMSLGAIDFGLLVDGSVVMIENLIRRLKSADSAMTVGMKYQLTLESAKEVAKPVIMGLLIIMVVYVPILSLEGIEGKMYHPMALTVLMALGSSLVVSIFLMPVLGFLILRGADISHKEPLFLRLIQAIYHPLLSFSLRFKFVFPMIVIPVFFYSLWIFSRIGSDFMPALNEGDMTIQFVHDSKISLTESIRRQRKIEKMILKYPQVNTVFARTGTSEAATDPMGVNLVDTFIILEKGPSENNRKDIQTESKQELFEKIRGEIEVEFKDVEVMQGQPIEMRFNEILEGSRADVSLRIYGKDLDALTDLQNKAKEILEGIPGVSEVELDALTALRKSPVLDVKLDFEKIARYGVGISLVNEILETTMAGKEVGSFYEYDWRFPIVVRLMETHRNNIQEISNIPVTLPEGGTIPLSKLADLNIEEKVTAIARSEGSRYAGIAMNLEDRDIVSFVNEAKEKLQDRLEIPEGFRLYWGGQFKNLERAKRKLMIIVPITLFIVFVLINQVFGSFRQTILVYLSIPFAITGGIFSLYLRGMTFSVSAAVGFIALAGIAILNGVVLVTFFNQLRQEDKSIVEAVRLGALIRLRPVIMTALVASLGFLPMAMNTGIGAEVQRPLATVVIGGLISSTLLTLLILPTLYVWIEGYVKGSK